MTDPYDPDQMPRHIPNPERRQEGAPMRRYGDELLIRIDERTQQLAAEMKALRDIVVSKAEFAPVRMLAFGLAGLLLVLVITAMVATAVVR